MNVTTRFTTALLVVGLAWTCAASSSNASSEPASSSQDVQTPPVPTAVPTVPDVPSMPGVSRTTQETVRRAMDAAKRVRTIVPHSMNGVNLWLSGEASSGGSLLVVPRDQPQEGQIAQTREDLGVMAKILTDRLHQADLSTDDGPGIFFGGQRTVRALYLGGFGAVFVIHVDFPLLPSTDSKQAPAEETSDEVWAKAKQQVLAPGSADDQGEKAPAFDQAKVSGLKETLTGAIKHATNIRALSAGESVAVVVMGGGPENAPAVHHMGMDVFGARPDAAGSTLVLKAGKADIDAFAKGQLDVDGFRKKVLTVTY